MSSSQLTGSTAVQYEIEELMSELMLQKVLLSSIDESVEDREAAEIEIRAEIKALERRLKDLRRGPTSSSPVLQRVTSERIPSQADTADQKGGDHANIYPDLGEF